MRSVASPGLIDPILIVHRPDIERVMAEQGLEKDAYPIVEAESELEAAELGVQKVLDRQAAALMKGCIHTDVLLHPVLTHLRTARRVSHIFVVELASYPKLLFVTDAAINIVPDLMTKAAIVQNAFDLARLFGIDRPKVAALSAWRKSRKPRLHTWRPLFLRLADEGNIGKFQQYWSFPV